MKGRVDFNEARKLIDIEILALKTRRNAYAPVSHLSDDLLLEIFRKIRHISFTVLLNASHVCRHWRRVALETTSLWTKPPTHRHHYTLLMLERSRSSTLSVQLNNLTSAETSAAVLDHIGRIESLIVEQRKALLGGLQEILLQSQHEAPQLKTLEITQSYRYLANDFAKFSASPFRKMPILQNLLLADVDFEWQMFPIPSLTSLHLFCVHLSTPPSWAEFQRGLNGMPCLEYLGLSLPDLRRTEPQDRSEHIELPRLHKLEVRDSSALVTRTILSNASFPQLRNANLQCSFNGCSDMDLDYSTTLRAVLLLISKGSFGRLGSLLIGDHLFDLATNSSSHPILTDECNIGFTAIYLERADTVHAWMTGLAAVPGDLSSEIVNLYLAQNLVDFTSKDLLELSGHLPQLESVHIHCQFVETQQIIKGLRIPLHPPDAPIPFPRLRSLELDHQNHADEKNPEVLEELGDCLRRRYRYGAGLSNLVVQWNMTEEEVQYVHESLDDLRIREFQVGWQ